MTDQTNASTTGAPTTGTPSSVSRKAVLKTGAAAAAGLAGAAVLGGVAPALAASPARSSAAQNVTLTMWSQDPLYVKFFTSRSTEFQALPAIKSKYSINFNIIQIPYAQIFDKLLGTLAAGSGAPDLASLEINAFSRFMKGSILANGMVDLKPLIGAQYHDFVEARWTPYSKDGHVYGVESGLSPASLYFRSNILSKIGMTGNDVFPTYDDVVSAGNMLKKKTGQYIFVVPVANVDIFSQMFQQVGGHYFGPDGSLTFDDPKAVSILTYMVNGAKAGIFYTPQDVYGPPMFAAYKQAKVASVLMPDWYGDQFLKLLVKEESGNWRIQLIPASKLGGHRVSVWGGTGFGVTKQSKNPDLAWQFLHYGYMTRANQIKRFQEIHYFPTEKNVLQSPEITSVTDPYYGGEKIGALYAAVATQVPTQYQSPYWNAFLGQAWTPEYTNAILGRKTPSQAIKDAVAAGKKILAQPA